LVLIGALAGFVSVQKTVDGRGVAVGDTGWRTWQTASHDPYSLAHYLDAGVLPPDPPQWMLYEAERDSSGARLNASCVYSLKGKMPDGRWWRLSGEGSGIPASTAHRSWLQSDGAIREADGSIRIFVSPSPRPANWIMPPPVSDLHLLLFVLEAPKGGQSAPPKIDRISCP
jgi:hypothetical protein